MSYLHINKEAAAIITDLGKNSNKKDSLVAKLSPLIWFTAFNAKTAASSEEHQEVKDAIIASFPKDERTLLAYSTAEMKALSEEAKADRRKLKQKIGARCGDLKKALQKLQEEKVAPTPKTAAQKIVDNLLATRKLAEKDEAPIYPVMEVLAKLDAAIAMMAKAGN